MVRFGTESNLAQSSEQIFRTDARVKPGHDEREACPPCLAPQRPLCAKKPAIRGEPMTKTIDMHTHVLADATVKLMQKEIPSLGLKMAPYDADNAVCEVAGVAYRPFPRGGHDIERRFKDMDAAEVDVHVLSVGAADLALRPGGGGRRRGVGDPERRDRAARQGASGALFRHRHVADAGADKAADELRACHLQARPARACRSAPTSTARISTSREFEPVWEVANEHNAFCMVHPNNVAGIDRMRTIISTT